MAPSGTTRCHPQQPGTPSPPPLFGCFPCHSPVRQLHRAGCTGNWMRLQPKSQGKDGSIKNPVWPARKPLPRRCPGLHRGCWNKGSKIKARPLGQPRAAARKLKGEKGPSRSTWKQVCKMKSA